MPATQTAAAQPFYGTMGLLQPPPGSSETDLDAWRTGGGIGTEDPSHSDWAQIDGQNFYRFGDPSVLNNPWVTQSTRDAARYDPLRGNLLPEAGAEQYLGGIRSIAAKNDDSARMWALGAGLLGGLPMAAHGAFGATMQGLAGGGQGAANAMDMFAGGAADYPVFEGANYLGGNGAAAGTGATGGDIINTLGGGQNTQTLFDPSFSPQPYGPGETGAFDMGQFSPTDVGLPGYGAPSGFLESLAQRFMPSGTGSIGSILKGLASTAFGSGGGGTGGSGNGWLGPLLSVGSGLYGLSESRRLRQLAEQSANRADPFGPYRGQFADQLSELGRNPQGVTNLPGYQAGLQAVQRSMASQGYQGSGNMMTALHKYGGDFYNNAIQQLAGLSGANFNPASGAQILMQGNQGAIDLASRSLASIGYGARGTDTLSQLLSRLAA